jgi:hypothetical protein
MIPTTLAALPPNLPLRRLIYCSPFARLCIYKVQLQYEPANQQVLLSHPAAG